MISDFYSSGLPIAMSIIGTQEGRSGIQELFRDVRVLITGGMGFMGQVMVEKLLRTCHDIDKIYLIVRPKRGKSEHERLEQLFNNAVKYYLLHHFIKIIPVVLT
jgi:FlaA1/EpsC-like NDP-sugar epimerase